MKLTEIISTLSNIETLIRIGEWDHVYDPMIKEQFENIEKAKQSLIELSQDLHKII